MQSTRRAVAGAAVAGGLAVAGLVAFVVAPDSDPARLALGGRTQEPGTPERSYPDPRPNPVGARLLPDLRSLPPEGVVIELTSDGRRLRFASIIANVGSGPIETVPDDLLPCPDEHRHASQVLYHDRDGNGRFDRDIDANPTTRPAGCMLSHAEHDHWHFDAAAKYWLAEPDDGRPITSSDKVSFCWRDNRRIGDAELDDFYGDCGYDKVQGITPGWADVYDERLADQHLDLPAELEDGTYCLWNEADPLDLLLEADESGNAAVTAIELAGTTVTEVSGVECAPSR